MSYEEKTIYKDTKTLQWCKEGLICELTDFGEKLMLADTKDDITNLLDALRMDIETVTDAVQGLEDSKNYFKRKAEEQCRREH